MINTFIVNAIKNKSLKINGDGKQTRSFCYVDDMIEGITSLMYSSHNDELNKKILRKFQ